MEIFVSTLQNWILPYPDLTRTSKLIRVSLLWRNLILSMLRNFHAGHFTQGMETSSSEWCHDHRLQWPLEWGKSLTHFMKTQESSCTHYIPSRYHIGEHKTILHTSVTSTCKTCPRTSQSFSSAFPECALTTHHTWILITKLSCTSQHPYSKSRPSSAEMASY